MWGHDNNDDDDCDDNNDDYDGYNNFVDHDCGGDDNDDDDCDGYDDDYDGDCDNDDDDDGCAGDDDALEASFRLGEARRGGGRERPRLDFGLRQFHLLLRQCPPQSAIWAPPATLLPAT